MRRLDINMSYLTKIQKDIFCIFTTFDTYLIEYTRQNAYLNSPGNRKLNQYQLSIEILYPGLFSDLNFLSNDTESQMPSTYHTID